MIDPTTTPAPATSVALRASLRPRARLWHHQRLRERAQRAVRARSARSSICSATAGAGQTAPWNQSSSARSAAWRPSRRSRPRSATSRSSPCPTEPGRRPNGSTMMVRLPGPRSVRQVPKAAVGEGARAPGDEPDVVLVCGDGERAVRPREKPVVPGAEQRDHRPVEHRRPGPAGQRRHRPPFGEDLGGAPRVLPGLLRHALRDLGPVGEVVGRRRAVALEEAAGETAQASSRPSRLSGGAGTKACFCSSGGRIAITPCNAAAWKVQ